VRVRDEPWLRLIDRNRLGQVARRYAVALSRGRTGPPGRRGRCPRGGRRGRPAGGGVEGVVPPGPLIGRLVSWLIGPRRLSRPYRLGGPARVRGSRRLGRPPGWRRT